MTTKPSHRRPERGRPNNSRPRRALAAGLLCAGLWHAPAAALPGLSQRMDAVIDRWTASERIVGVTAIVARDGDVVYRRAAGHADREANTAARLDTIYRLASMTKAIVSATALALVDEGRMGLDDPVSRWLPYFRPALADGRRPAITVRQLMSHTSGLSYAFFEAPGNAYQRGAVPQGLEASRTTLEGAMRQIAAAPLFYEPGTEWRYSVSIDVLGAVIEQASGLTLPRAVAKYVTDPLGMRDTAFMPVDTNRLAAAYRDGDDEREGARARRLRQPSDRIPLGEDGVTVAVGRTTDPTAWPSGGGGLSGTAEDYLRFLEAIRTGGAPILSADSVRLLTTHQIGDLRAWTEGEGWGHSLGAAVLLDAEAAKTPQSVGTWQWGGVLGTHWFVDPHEGLTVVVLTNTSVAGVIGAFPAEIRDAVYGAGSMGTN